MKQVVICRPDLQENAEFSILQKDQFEMEGIKVHCALIDLAYSEEFLNKELPAYRVLVKKLAFTCNYRDKGIILTAAAKYNYISDAKRNVIVDPYTGIGSDYVAEVVQVGAEVKDLKVGDRVINNGSYPNRFETGSQVPGCPPGLPTNTASSRFEVVHRGKIMRIPAEMSLDVAAGFTIGGQTSYGMIRRLNIKSGDNILITAAKSNTSLFTLSALAHRKDVNLYLASTSNHFKEELSKFGIQHYLRVNDSNELFVEQDQHKLPIYGFDAVIDPFSDIYFSRILQYMAIGGRYITCGIQNQYSHITRKEYKTYPGDFKRSMETITLKSISVIGNCLGLDDDLKNAIEAHRVGNFPVAVDQSQSYNEKLSDFFSRTYLDKNRFGKVVYRYD